MSPDPVVTGVPPRVAASCVLSVDEWTRTLLDLLPRGACWPREPGTTIEAFWMAIADAMLAIQTRDCALLDESYPCGAVELLPDWERELGLPDECTQGTWTIAQRQAFVCAKLAAQGGQSRDYFIYLAALYGFQITIVEHWPWRMGCTTFCDARVGVPPMWWQVIATALDCTVLKCVIRRAAPAGSTVSFICRRPALWNIGLWNIDFWSA
ncbi:MAG TPA: putative phage tail protein [Thermomicrobiales bacterium]|jgi:uncharacterized protein YmfQ (DUF2313 family)